jgi:hypothetical protein
MHIMSPVSSELLGREAITGEGGWVKYTMMQMLRNDNRAEYIERLSKDTLDTFRDSGLDLINTELDPPSETQVIYRDITESSWIEEDKETGEWTQFVYVKSNDTVHETNSSMKEDPTFGAIRKYFDGLEERGYDIDDGCFDSTRYVTKHAGDEMFIMAKVPDLIPSSRSWYAQFMEILYLDPDLGHRICDAYLELGKSAVRKYIEIGVDCVMIASDWASNLGAIFSPAQIREYLIPAVSAICELCHENDVFVLKHTDGNIMKFADDFFAMGIDGYQSVDPGAGMDIELMKKKYGDRVLLMGNVDCARTLPYGSVDEIIEETKSVIRKASPGGGHILSSSNTITYPTPAKSFLAMVEAAHEYGRYPIDLD